MSTRAPLLCLALAGCYTSFGLGYAGGNHTGHGSVGVVVHFDEDREVGSVRLGAGGSFGRYNGPDRDGSLYPGPAVIGGHARLLGSSQDALVVDAELHEPHGAWVSFKDPEQTERALATRAFVGLGYRHKWLDVPRGQEAPRSAASVILAAGPEVFWGTTDLFGRSIDGGVTASVVFTIRAWVFGKMAESLLSK